MKMTVEDCMIQAMRDHGDSEEDIKITCELARKECTPEELEQVQWEVPENLQGFFIRSYLTQLERHDARRKN